MTARRRERASSKPGGGGFPVSTRTRLCPPAAARSRYAAAWASPRPLVSDRVRTRSSKTPSSSSESLNSARRRSPWRNSRSIGAIRSMASCSAPGVSIFAARSTVRMSIRSSKDLELHRRAARAVTAIGQNLGRHLAFEPASAPLPTAPPNRRARPSRQSAPSARAASRRLRVPTRRCGRGGESVRPGSPASPAAAAGCWPRAWRFRRNGMIQAKMRVARTSERQATE